jgi:HAE1 family hydrophobic/amphiphilic exporter-1
VALPVLAATFTTAIVFFPGCLPLRRQPFLFTALALSVVLSLFASYAVAMTVVPLFCARFQSASEAAHLARCSSQMATTGLQRFVRGFNRRYDRGLLLHYDIAVRKSLLKAGGDGAPAFWDISC